MNPVNLLDASRLLPGPWTPRVVAAVNDHRVKLALLEGDFPWHRHEVDELFLVLEGRLGLALRDRMVELGPGELFVVPAGAVHRPHTLTGQVRAVIVEPEGVVNTGDAEASALTAEVDAWLEGYRR